ncbi:MAG: methyltransferase domain-containing protein [Deltaproteobacteria bacterium]|nr:methyltransferase domain-containing protein [Deltaproteobacteria bacterium]
MRALYETAWETIAALDLEGEARAHTAEVEALGRGERVLDLGRGRGADAAALAERFREVIAIDVAAAGSACPPPPGVTLLAADLERPLPLADGAVDAVLALDVIEHLADPGALLAELARTLRRGGRLVLTTPNGRFHRHGLEWLRGRPPRTIDESGLLAGLPAPHHGHISLLTSSVLTSWLRAAGFEIEELAGVGHASDHWLRWSRWLPRAARRELFAQGLRVVARRTAAPAPIRRAREVSAIVVTDDGGEDLEACLAALAAVRGPVRVSETFVVDNASTDGAVERAKARFPATVVLANPSNRGFGAAVNLAAGRAHAPRLLVLNPDVTLRPGAITAMEAMFGSDPALAVAGGRLTRPDGTPALSWVHFPTPRVIAAWLAARLGAARLAGWLTPAPGAAGGGPIGACLLVDRDTFHAVGGFDERFFLYAEEIDLCERLRRAGRSVACAPIVVGTHREGGSTARVPDQARAAWLASHEALYRKWRRPLAGWLFRQAFKLAGAP